MKRLSNLFLVLIIGLSFSSCKDGVESCIEDIVGSYSGTLNCGTSADNVGFSVVESTSNNEQVIFKFAAGDIIVTVDEDCNYSMETTNFNDPVFGEISYGGTGNLDGDNLKGSLLYTQSGASVICDLDVNK